MATRRMCDVCGIRPAVVTVRRIVPGEGQRVEHLCEIHAAEAGVGRSSFGRRSPLGGGGTLNPGDKVIVGAGEGRLAFEVLEGAVEAPEGLQVEERT